MRTFTAVVNPAAGNRRRTAAGRVRHVVQRLREAGAAVRVETTRSLQHSDEIASAAVARGDVVLAVGGDGTVGRLAGTVVRTGGVLGILPAGRGNDFARQLGLPTDPDAIAKLLLRESEPQLVDVIETAGTIVVGSIYTGIDAIANRHFNRVRPLGAAGYHYSAGRALLTWRMATYHVTVDGTEHNARGYTVVLANSGFYGDGRHAAPDARVDDGLLDIVILRDVSRWGFVSIAMKELYSGAHLKRPEVEVLRGREVRVEADRELPYGGDGELLSTLPVTARVLPGALRVLAS
ncbi:diacylglycerol kinase family protein [Phytoactinopolyspora mesophila]|uniref:Diacylglycerol kinase family lipid kinase n=1 Tax=Phytoactinopolyspora mesophila TaxID=2650750 RepID=A0A7K3M8T0_9ACTN|nr:diacylglycerol kinase family lipid kinase [Phytoactinopolyspora mesophila]